MAVTDNLNAREAASIARIVAVAAFRKGVLTTRQQRAIDRIVNGANERAAAKAKEK